ncbi:MAG: alcohol dehydrogenase catalytic domain-containing protein [Clostridiaceae bacterium]|nr:alcohol dehydrogenase catalytic domain-containing protein [Clostridiaceae bacterium]
MRQITLINPEKFEMKNVEVPEPEFNEIQIKVKYIGICGSDIHAYFGKHPFISCPITLGHEFVGTISKLGKNVEGFKIGDIVTAMPQIYCGECEPCKEGRYNICDKLLVIGCQSVGASSDYFTFDASIAKKFPADFDFKTAVMAEPVAVGVHAVSLIDSLDSKNVVVLGSGTIGNVTAQAAIAQGAKNVLITDISDEKLEIAKKCGIQYCVNTLKEDLAEQINYYFGEKADVFIECVGIGATINQAIKLSKKGRDIIVLGVFEDNADIEMGLVQDKELRLIGSLMYIEKDFDLAIKYLVDGTINTEPMITDVLPFEDYEKAFSNKAKQSDINMKTLIKVD